MRFLKTSATAIAAVMLAGSALAADLPSRKAPPVAYAPLPVFTWTGFYVGAQVGYTSEKFSQTENFGGIGTGTQFGWSGSGVVGGGHAGFNYQISSIVLGLEGDIEGASVKGTTQVTDGFGNIIGDTAKNNFRGSLRGRAGVAFDRALLYATGGLAFGTIKGGLTNPFLGSDTFSSSRTGYTVGGGLEYAFTPSWSARIEYRYTDLGKTNFQSAFVFPAFSYTTRNTDNSVRVGVSYHFGGFGAGPVVAKY